VAVAGLVGGCATPYGRPGEKLLRRGDEIVVAGQFFHTGTRVVLWMDPGGYDAYRLECRFARGQTQPSRPVSDSPARYSSLRRHLPQDIANQVMESGWTVPLLAEHVDLLVVHYDACGTSRRCFEVLHDIRGLSAHFLLDVDGTIYQTLDVKERAWHAGVANDRSVGIEIANIGAYEDPTVLENWYCRCPGCGRTYLALPAQEAARWPGLELCRLQPARNELICGKINGRVLHQHDLTDAQYEALIRLVATLCRVLPRIRPEYPRDAQNRVRDEALSAEELASFSGIVGHWHVTCEKVDPGPAFDWERFIRGVRRELRRCPW